jgi:nitrogen-specific signal transduction histidine kinase
MLLELAAMATVQSATMNGSSVPPGLPRQEQARDGAQGGSLGLGLYISKAIVTAHGGRVGVRSTVTQGSTFWFTLPLADTRSLAAGAAA